MRTIFHVDVNSAFLSWSALKQLQEHPGSVDLRTIPSAVGGDVKTRHGIITAKSIPAKQYGIQTGEPVVQALAKCPGLVLVKSDFAVYRGYSSQFMALLRKYTPFVEQASIDEAYMDMSGISGDNAGKLAREIADAVKEGLGFTVNVGISSNKFLAKMASDFSKPDKVHTLYPEEIRDKLWPLPIDRLHGCGQATAGKLRNMAINTIGEAADADLAVLQNILGIKAGAYIHERANGRDDSQVRYQEREAKSYSNETTMAEDVNRENYRRVAVPILKGLCDKVSSRLRKDGVCGSTVSIMVKTGSFQRYSRQTTLYSSTSEAEEIFSKAQKLMDSLVFGPDGLFRHGQVLRLIGVGISNLDKGENRQMTLLEWSQTSEIQTKQKEKEKKLDQMMEVIHKKYGNQAIRKGN